MQSSCLVGPRSIILFARVNTDVLAGDMMDNGRLSMSASEYIFPTFALQEY